MRRNLPANLNRLSAEIHERSTNGIGVINDERAMILNLVERRFEKALRFHFEATALGGSEHVVKNTVELLTRYDKSSKVLTRVRGKNDTRRATKLLDDIHVCQIGKPHRLAVIHKPVPQYALLLPHQLGDIMHELLACNLSSLPGIEIHPLTLKHPGPNLFGEIPLLGRSVHKTVPEELM